MKIKKHSKKNPPLSHSNLSTEENLASQYDPNGSYTGIPAPPFGFPYPPDEALPVQDVDDL